MDAAFLAVVAVSFLFISAMIVMRMSAAGMTARRIAWPLAELWLTLGLWIAVLWAGARLRGGPKIGASVILVLVVGLTAHLLWLLQKNMSGNVRS